jgi:hypothetical protein
MVARQINTIKSREKSILLHGLISACNYLRIRANMVVLELAVRIDTAGFGKEGGGGGFRLCMQLPRSV